MFKEVNFLVLMFGVKNRHQLSIVALILEAKTSQVISMLPVV